MQTYIALLRGINVSGVKKIRMVELREHLNELDFGSIQTYIQSGNIVFQSEEKDQKVLEKQIHEKILEKYGFEVPTLVRTPKDLKRAVAENPMKDVLENDPKRLYLTFLDEVPEKENVEKIESFDPSPDRFVLQGRNLYFYSPLGNSKSKISNNFFEKKLKVAATSRNWRTVNTLIGMSEEVG